ncbi:MAG TPA: PAS domain-containing protein [Roseimicrobium sp.]|nr:PAS domain-containing protein [Roseimicrobium sp.]
MKTNRSFTPVAEQLTDAIVITDAKGRVAWINPAFTRLCGYSLKELKGQKPGPLLQGPETDPKASRALHNAIHRGRTVTVELVNYHKEKWPYSVWISINPIKDRSGKITGFLAVERETTALQCELRKLENDIAHLYEILCRVTSAEKA